MAGRHARHDTPADVAVAELRELAGGRADLLAQVAGAAAGTAESSPYPPWQKREAELCVQAGADETLIPGVVAEVAERLRRPMHGV